MLHIGKFSPAVGEICQCEIHKLLLYALHCSYVLGMKKSKRDGKHGCAIQLRKHRMPRMEKSREKKIKITRYLSF